MIDDEHLVEEVHYDPARKEYTVRCQYLDIETLVREQVPSIPGGQVAITYRWDDSGRIKEIAYRDKSIYCVYTDDQYGNWIKRQDLDEEGQICRTIVRVIDYDEESDY